MIHVLTEDEYIEGPTAEYVVERMFHSSRLPPDGTLREYMRAVATRVKLWNGDKIRIGAAELFLKDLAKKGFILIDEVASHGP